MILRVDWLRMAGVYNVTFFSIRQLNDLLRYSLMPYTLYKNKTPVILTLYNHFQLFQVAAKCKITYLI